MKHLIIHINVYLLKETILVKPDFQFIVPVIEKMFGQKLIPINVKQYLLCTKNTENNKNSFVKLLSPLL